MKLISVIGTRPQYIKIKPLYDYCIKENIDHTIIDTNQHYSSNVSDVFIKEFNLNIKYKLKVKNNNASYFLSDAITKIYDIFNEINPVNILVYGDTNSTLAAAIVANKMGINVCHIEAGIRCGDKNRPEEMNRILIDELSKIHFVSREKDCSNVANPVYIGDLEYCLLNKLEEEEKIQKIEYQNFYLMTIHRQENSNRQKIQEILNFCDKLKYPVIWPIHHRIKPLLKDISMTDNISIIDPLSYTEMINKLSKCNGIISDSGGVTKIAPFFGKKCIIPLETNEWDDIVKQGYGQLTFDSKWLEDSIIERNKDLYYHTECCETIIKTIN